MAYIKNNPESIHFLQCREQASVLLNILLRNNKYLCKQAGHTLAWQRKDIKKRFDINLSANTVKDIQKGKMKSVQFTYLVIYSYYWNIPLYQLISHDFALNVKLKNDNINNSVSSLSVW